jgi:hypothetical protein
MVAPGALCSRTPTSRCRSATAVVTDELAIAGPTRAIGARSSSASPTPARIEAEHAARAGHERFEPASWTPDTCLRALMTEPR